MTIIVHQAVLCERLFLFGIILSFSQKCLEGNNKEENEDVILIPT